MTTQQTLSMMIAFFALIALVILILEPDDSRRP